MYRPLVACSACRRHVHASEAHCPFCGAERTPVAIEPIAMARMSRAATLAAALAVAGCRSEPTPIANDPAAAKPSAAKTASPSPPPDAGLVDDPGGQVDIYGAPPPPPSTTVKPKPTVPAPPYGVPPPPKP